MNVGGPALQVTGLVRGLDASRFDHRLYVGNVGDDEADFVELRAPDLPVRRITGLGRSPSAFGDVRALRELVAQFRQFRPHIVHTHTAKAGVLGRIAARITRTPYLVHTYHGHLLHGYFSPFVTAGVVQTERTLARRTDRLVAVGEKVRDELLAARVGRLDQYVIVPPGIPLGQLPSREAARQSLGLPTDGLVVTVMARLVPIKRIDRFLAAAQIVLETHPESTFAISGDGPLATALREQAGALHGRVRFLGWRADVEAVHAATDVAVLCSDNEGMPVSLIEAALAGVPAVTTNVGSAAEVVLDGATGFVVDTTPESIAVGISRLLNDGSLRLRLGNAAREHATKNFAQARLVSDTERLYDELIGQQR
jgi:glycosyltransferase involved in cell wall biosynthesis